MSPGSIHAEKGPRVLGRVLGSAGLAECLVLRERLNCGIGLPSAARRVAWFRL